MQIRTKRLFGFVPVFALLFSSEAPATEGMAFFESKIRPVLVEKCYSCHSVEAEKSKGGLLLDSKNGWMSGGDSGPALVSGQPEESALISAIAYGGEIPEMPPKERLPENVVEDFREWIAMGAPDPRTEGAAKLTNARVVDDAEIARAREDFWAYHPLPETHEGESIDSFLNAALEEAGVAAVEAASPRDLVRRLYFDLTGLPPSPTQIDAFLESAAEDLEQAVETLVDTLLESPRFGEKWGRHWLDLARYADSNGGDINLTYPHAWRYRDYVIDAFNRDEPYDQFIIQQLAGDLIEGGTLEEQVRRRVATGYLVIGPKMLSERDKEKMHLDIVDEQLDSIGRTFLGLTLGCARCHDHKFDAIPTADYYAMAGILRNTRTAEGIRMNNVNVTGWIEQDLPVDEAHGEVIAAYREKREAQEAEIKALKAEVDTLKKGVGDYSDLPGVVIDNEAATYKGEWVLSSYSKNRVGVDYRHDDAKGKGEKEVVWSTTLEAAGEYEVRISFSGQGGRANRVPVVVRHAKGEETRVLNQSQTASINGVWEPLGRFQFSAGEPAEVFISTKETTGYVIADAVHFIPVEEIEAIESERERLNRERLTQREKTLKAAEATLAALKKAAPEIPRGMVAADRPAEEIGDLKIRIRGEPKNLGESVERGFLRVASYEAQPQPSLEHSGRLEMARWIASEKNPLTARVWVNRLWQHLFGEGIVRTADNFGELGDRPSHPELLGWLAADHIEAGWSTKHTLRRILLSKAYQRASRPNGENRLFAHQNRRRLSGEALRDSLIFLTGALELESPGSTVGHLGEQAITNSANNGKSTQKTEHLHRAVYLPMVRNDMPAFLETFDMANPDMVTGKRPATTVPAQALLMLNATVVKETASALLDRYESTAEIYRVVLGREPTSYELDRADQFVRELVDENDVTTEEASRLLIQSILASTEFRFVN